VITLLRMLTSSRSALLGCVHPSRPALLHVVSIESIDAAARARGRSASNSGSSPIAANFYRPDGSALASDCADADRKPLRCRCGATLRQSSRPRNPASAPQEYAMTRIGDIMTRGVELIQRDDTLQHAAQRMRALDVGALPVADGKALVGMVTDRDIAVRGVAAGMIPQESLVSDVMTEQVRWCSEDETVEQVLAQMGDEQVRRLPVLNAAREVVGIVALGDLATRQPADTEEALREISSPDT
jgi:CBS domain-containing protein